MGSDKEGILDIPVRIGSEQGQFAHPLKGDNFIGAYGDRMLDFRRPKHIPVPYAPAGILEQLVRVSHFLGYTLMVRVRVEKVVLPGESHLVVGS